MKDSVQRNEYSISVIIPCYNCEEFIKETLESLEMQDYRNFELICVDDGSTDHTLAILESFKRSTQLSVHIISQINSGVSSARNTGMTAAHGVYYLFLDSDDVINSHLIALLYEEIKNEGYDTVYFRYSRELKETLEWSRRENASIQEVGQEDAMRDLLFQMGQFSFACFLYKGDILKKNDIVFDEGTKHFEDREFNWKYLCNCKKICKIDAPLYGYRINKQSVTQRGGDCWADDGIKAAFRVENYLKSHNCSYYETVKNYLVYRVLWSRAKAYAIARDKKSFIRLRNEYDLDRAMKAMRKDTIFYVRVLSIIYCVSPILFYNVLSFFQKSRG